MKRFEAFLGSDWKAWEASDTVAITKKANVVTITTEPKEKTETHPGHDRLKTVFNLSVIPAYTIG